MWSKFCIRCGVHGLFAFFLSCKYMLNCPNHSCTCTKHMSVQPGAGTSPFTHSMDTGVCLCTTLPHKGRPCLARSALGLGSDLYPVSSLPLTLRKKLHHLPGPQFQHLKMAITILTSLGCCEASEV